MTFDPSRRLKDALGIGDAAGNQEVAVPEGDAAVFIQAASMPVSSTPVRLSTDLVARYAPDESVAAPHPRESLLSAPGRPPGRHPRIHGRRAPLRSPASEGRYERVILDTPPTAQAIDFLEAPARIVDFLDSGALKIALAPWFAADGRLRPTSGLGFVGRGLEHFLDRVVGMQLLRDMSEFFRAFGPLFDGFRQRARKTEKLLAAPGTLFVLVTAAGVDRIPDTLFFARKLEEEGCRLGPVVVNRLHPELAGSGGGSDGERLFRWLGERHRRGLIELRGLLRDDQVLVALPLMGDEPTDLESLDAVGQELERLLAAAG